MGYYMRYFVTDERPVRVTDFVDSFVAAGQGARLIGEATDGEVQLGDRAIAQVTVNMPGDGLFEEECAEFIEMVEDSDNEAAPRVVAALQTSTCVVAVQLLFGNLDTDEVLDALEPLWDWLHTHRRGLMQADGEGFYDNHELILELE